MVAGCATPDERTPQERAADQALALRVDGALGADPYLDADNVTVEVTRGVVRLSGLVRDDDDLRRTLHLCYGVPGVKSVDDQLEIVDFGDSGGSDHPTQ